MWRLDDVDGRHERIENESYARGAVYRDGVRFALDPDRRALASRDQDAVGYARVDLDGCGRAFEVFLQSELASANV